MKNQEFKGICAWVAIVGSIAATLMVLYTIRISILVAALGINVASIQGQARKLLESIGPPAAPALVESMLYAENPAIQDEALSLLIDIGIGYQELLPMLIEAWAKEDERASVVLWGSTGIGSFYDFEIFPGTPSSSPLSPPELPTIDFRRFVVPYVIHALDHPSARYRIMAVRILAEIGPDAGAAVIPLLEALESNKVSYSSVSLALQEIVPHQFEGLNWKRLVPFLVRELEAPFRLRRLDALMHLEDLGGGALDAIPALLKFLESDDEALVHGALNVLDEIVSLPREAVPALGQILRLRSRDLQDEAFDCLVEIGPTAEPALPLIIDGSRRQGYLDDRVVSIFKGIGGASERALEKMLQSEGPTDQLYAAEALSAIKKDPELYLPVFRQWLSHPCQKVRYVALDQLLNLKPDPEDVMPFILERLLDDSQPVRFLALEGLQSIQTTAEEKRAAVFEVFQGSALPVLLEAANLFREIEPQESGPLPRYLRDEQEAPEIRLAAGFALARQMPERCALVLADLTGHHRPAIRRYALWFFSRVGITAEDAMPVIVKRLEDSEPMVRAAAADALATYQKEALPLLPALKNAWRKEKDPEVQGDLRRAWLKIVSAPFGIEVKRQPVPEALIEATRHEDFELRREAFKELKRYGETALPVVLDALSDREGSTRLAAARVLEALESLQASDAPALLALLGHEEPEIRQAAAMALRTISEDRMASFLIKQFQSANGSLRLGSALALGTVQWSWWQSKEIYPLLVEALQDEELELRLEAARALGWLGRPVTIPILLEAACDYGDVPRVRAAAALSIWKIRDSESNKPYDALQASFQVLMDVLRTGDILARIEAADALGQIGSNSIEAIPALALTAASKDPVLRRTAIRALAEIDAKSPQAASVFLHANADPDESVRAIAALKLLNLCDGPVSTLNVVIGALEEAKPEVRREAATILGRWDRPPIQALGPLLKGLSDKDEAVRRAIIGALGNLGPAARKAVPILSGHALEEFPFETCDALKQIDPSGESYLPNFMASLKDQQSLAEVRCVKSLAVWLITGRVRDAVPWRRGETMDPALRREFHKRIPVWEKWEEQTEWLLFRGSWKWKDTFAYRQAIEDNLKFLR